jgi:LAO/AO transport system kinase
MRDLAGDTNVFIRSMATRGSLGGLAQATANMAQVFDAAGFDIVIIETVGAGQSEVDVARLAHTTLVVEAPGLGDEIQAIKAGILEIADILVVNKGDRPGVENTEKALKSMLELAHPTERVFQHHGSAMQVSFDQTQGKSDPLQQTSATLMWIPPIQRTVSTEGKGIVELAEAIARHVEHLRQSGDWAVRERARIEVELEALVRESLMEQFRENTSQTKYQDVLEKIMQRNISPWEAVKILMKEK